MQYKLIGSNDTSNLIATTLANRGIDNWQEYLNLNAVNDEEYNGLDNIEAAVKCFVDCIERGSEVGILFDTDT